VAAERHRATAALARAPRDREDLRAARARGQLAGLEPHYLADPEIFFGQRPDYMLEVLLADHREDEITVEADDPSGPQRWRLLILEDTGELLATDAKERGGQACRAC